MSNEGKEKCIIKKKWWVKRVKRSKGSVVKSEKWKVND